MIHNIHQVYQIIKKKTIFSKKKTMEENFGILFNRERYELNVCEQNIALFTKYINDYEHLKTRLSTLADRTRHDIMIPIGGTKLAYMPGYIHHTNEILVLLGDNYFVEKSTKEAIEFVERRLKFCREKLNDLERQKSIINEWLNTTTNLQEESSQFVNITETCTEEEYQQWIRERNEKIREKNKNKSNRSKEMSKEELNNIFAKYENEQMENDNDQPFKSQIIERLVPDSQPSEKQETTTISTSHRPQSKFKASRIKNQ